MNHLENTRPVIVHYGVKGMRWGVRNDEPPTGGYSGSKKVPNTGTPDSGKTDARPEIITPETLKLTREQRLQARETRLQKEAQEAALKEARLRKAANQSRVTNVLKLLGGVTLAVIGVNVLRNGAYLAMKAINQRMQL